jgi:hypothetical protein
MKFLILGLMATLSVSLFAKEGGNGGDVLICETKENTISSIQFLDLYEGREERNLRIELSHYQSRREGIKAILEAHRDLEPLRFDKYLTRALALEQQLGQLENGGVSQSLVKFTSKNLLDIPDTGYLALPENCRATQLIVQHPSPLPGDKKFIFRKDLWLRLDLESQIAAILHEIVLEDFLIFSYGDDSGKARYFNEIILSMKFADGTADSWQEFLKSMKVTLAPTDYDWEKGSKGMDWTNFPIHFPEEYDRILKSPGNINIWLGNCETVYTYNRQMVWQQLYNKRGYKSETITLYKSDTSTSAATGIPALLSILFKAADEGKCVNNRIQ